MTARRSSFASLVAFGLAVANAAPAAAQLEEVAVDRGPTNELYIRKRPPNPESPEIPKDLQPLLARKEKLRDAKRKEAIDLLRKFLGTDPTGEGKAEGLFKLAELLWEDARATYVANLDKYERRLEFCRQTPGECKRPPREPRLDFAESETLYKQILAEFPSYRRADLVLYLVGFAAREGGRYEEGLGYFRQVIDKHPESPLYADSWMMLGEHLFSLGRWAEARDAYKNILDRPESQAFDLALFKTAWADWKLGDTESAAKRFKLVLDLAEEAERSGSEKLRRRRSQLRDEALDYLVLVFTEDESVTAKDVYEFLASIGGERYSRDVLVRLADMFFNEASYGRAQEAYRFLIALDPAFIGAAKYQRRIVEANLSALEYDKALAQVKTLTETYGPGSDWAEANSERRDAVVKSFSRTERMVRGIGKNFHGEAQEDEKSRGGPDLDLYRRAATTYQYYLAHFGKTRNAPEVRFLRGEILFFKTKEYEAAGDEYLAVGQSKPVGKYHKDALLKAMAAFEKARPNDVNLQKRRELLPVDRKFADATDLFATLYPADPQIVGVIYRNGQRFYDYGDYDEAIKRFGLIVTKYPDHEDAGAAGDRILDSLNKGKDYENIETWARKLKKAKAFQAPAQQQRLDRLIVESIVKSGETYGASGEFAKAASFYERVPKEFPNHKMAPQALYNSAVMYEKARKPVAAATAYLSVAGKYPKSKTASKAAFTAAQVYESNAYFERAADAYEEVADKYPRGEHGADALYNAGVLRQALGQNRRAIAHYQRYAKRFRDRKDAPEVAFRVGVVHEQAGDDKKAGAAYRSYLKRYRRADNAIEAHTRAGRTALKLRQQRRARESFGDALKLYKRADGDERKAATPWAAEARYRQGELLFEEYAAISLDVKPRKLKRTLDKKSKLLGEALELYLEVVEFGDPQWATAALYRMGQVYEQFANSMINAPVPKGLSESEAEVYRSELDNYVIDIEEQAISLYTTGYQKALDLGVYNKYTRLLREALGRMAASQFPPETESREGQRMGDRPPPPAILKEVVRE